MHVVELERCHDDDIGGLKDFFLRFVVKISNAGCSLTVRCHFNAQNFRFRTVGEVRHTLQRIQNGRLWR